MTETHKTYLGDSVYAEIEDEVMLKLTTNNGGEPTNTVLLEPEVVSALIRYIQKELEGKP